VAEVVWAESALKHVEEIIAFVAGGSISRADKLQEKLLAAPEILVHTPRLGRRVPEFNIEELRELLVKPYRILYLLRDDTCFVVAVIHARRDLARAFDPTEIDDLPS
jgi:plasmid stabilization system protein ParE